MFVANISSIRQYSYIESFYNFSHFVMVPNGIPIVLVSLQSFFFSCIVCTHSNRNICTISKDWNLFPLICTVRCSRLMGFLFDFFFRRVFNGDFVWHGHNTVIYRQFFSFIRWANDRFGLLNLVVQHKDGWRPVCKKK